MPTHSFIWSCYSFTKCHHSERKTEDGQFWSSLWHHFHTGYNHCKPQQEDWQHCTATALHLPTAEHARLLKAAWQLTWAGKLRILRDDVGAVTAEVTVTTKQRKLPSLVCLHNSHNFSTKSFVHYAYRLVISSLWTDVPVYSDFSSLHHLLCPYVYDWSVPTVWVNNCYTPEVSELKCFSEMCYFAILVQHPSGNGDEGDPRWISRLTTNWRVNDHEPSLCWWHHPVGHFGDRTTGVGGSPRPSQLQIQPTHQRRQEQGNGEQRHSVPHTHSEWTTGAGGYVPVPWAPDYRRWWDTMEFRTRQAIGASLQEIWKSQHTDLNDDMTNESASVGLWLPPFCKQNLLFI